MGANGVKAKTGSCGLPALSTLKDVGPNTKRKSLGTGRINEAGEPSGPTGPTRNEPGHEYKCGAPGCDRSFPTVRGKGVHEQRAHKAWYDQKQAEGIVNKRAPWSNEELSLMARAEAKLTSEGVRLINMALVPLVPNRSLEAIKGQRRYQKYKDMVLRYLEEIREEANTPPTSRQVEIDEDRSEQSQYNAAIREELASLDSLTGTKFNGDHLERICRNLAVWPKERVSEELETYLLETFPLPQERPKRKTVKTSAPTTKRQMRRADYARTQKAWTVNPCKCLKALLKNKSSDNTPSEDIMIPFWTNVMTGKDNQSPGAEMVAGTIRDLWEPVKQAEVKEAFPATSTAPGPDGLSARELRAVPMEVLIRIFNLMMFSGRLPRHLLESRTTLIPKKDGASEPGDYRPITVSSVLTRTFHKILASRLARLVKLDSRQKAFVPVDGAAQNIFDLDMVLRYHRQNFKPLYMASVDVSKAFDCVTHKTIEDTMKTKGVPVPMISYIADIYHRSNTRLACKGWESDPIHPTCGVKQGDPLSPIIFNMIMDGLIRQIPPEIGVEVDGKHHNAFAFADDLIFLASTPKGLQTVLDTATNYLAQCGLRINASKSFTVAIRNVPHVKKAVVDGKIIFSCSGQNLPALRRSDEWKYLGVPFTPEGSSRGNEIEQLRVELEKLTKAPLKPQQRLFALRVMVLPGLYHLLTLGNTTLSRLKKVDTMVRSAVRKWVCLPHDLVSAYIHAKAKDGGLSIPSMRWLMPLMRRQRLLKYASESVTSPYLTQELQRTERRLRDGHALLGNTTAVEQRWANLLHRSVDGGALSQSSKVPQQHQWITDGTRLLSGKDFINAIKLRINAMPTRSRTARGRIKDRHCRAGCNAIETLNHVLQQCHRTHKARIERHDAVTSYIKRAMEKTYEAVEVEPKFQTEAGLRKPDLIAKKGTKAIILDAQVVSERMNLEEAHRLKTGYYRPLINAVKERYRVRDVELSSVTLSYRGVWSQTSAQYLVERKILRKTELKIIATRVLIGGLNSFWRFNKTTMVRRANRTGIG